MNVEKLPGLFCPYSFCEKPKCIHRCDNCEAKFYWKHPITGAPCEINPRTRRKIPYDSAGNLHNKCMENGVTTWRGPSQDSMMHDLHEYLRHSLRLHSNGVWYTYHDGKYGGPYCKATAEELTSWDPNKK